MLQLADKCCIQVALCGGLFYCLVGVSRSVLSVGNKHCGRLRYSCVMVGKVSKGKSGRVLTCGQCGLRFVW